MALHLTKRRFTVAEYYQMAEAGILGEDDRVELIDGEIIEMTPIGRRHAACVDRLNRLFARGIGEAAQIRVQNPVQLDEYSEPQPDLTLLRPRPDFYASGHPTPADVLLLIEVGDTSAEVDRQVKVPLYAGSGIQELWLIDLEQETVTAYRDLADDRYRLVQPARRGDRIAPAAFPDRDLTVADILG
jgi:Uma2 family endonuclease